MNINANTNNNRYNELTPAIAHEIDKLVNSIASRSGLWTETNVTASIAALRATL